MKRGFFLSGKTAWRHEKKVQQISRGKKFIVKTLLNFYTTLLKKKNDFSRSEKTIIRHNFKLKHAKGCFLFKKGYKRIKTALNQISYFKINFAFWERISFPFW
jgi:hypothetical protein